MNKHNKYTLFLAADNDGGGANGRIVAVDLPPVDVGSGSNDNGNDNSSGNDNNPEPVKVNPTPTNPTPPLDFSKFSEELKGVFKEGFAAVKADVAPVQKLPPTPEQLADARKALKFWEPDEAFLQEFGNVTTQKDAFIKLRDGLMTQLLTIVGAQDTQNWQQREQQLMSHLTPLQQYHQEQLAAKVQGDFNKTYPALADPKYNSIISAVGAELEKNKGYTGKNQTENMKILADNVAQVLQTANPQFTLGGTTPPEKNEPSGNGISSTSTGSGGGGGTSGGGKGKFNNNPVVSALGVPKPRG